MYMYIVNGVYCLSVLLLCCLCKLLVHSLSCAYSIDGRMYSLLGCMCACVTVCFP